MPGERPPRVLGGRYRLLHPIARGGMAEVWEGHDEVLARSVAVKVLLESLASEPSVRERFRREAVTAARLAHPNVVATFDTGIDEGTAYIVMELVRGPTLRDLLAERGPLPVPVALSVADQVADALAHAHRAGLVHRDIKPGNVLVAEEEAGALRVKVTDFGIAKAAEGAADLTLTGMVLGTPKYLSPEQVEGREPDARADLYALGVVLFEMLVGRAPFQGPTQMATALSHLRDQAPAPSSLRPAIPPAVDALVAALLAKDPAGRYPTALDVRRALAEAALDGGGRAIPPAPVPGRRRPATDPTTVATSRAPWLRRGGWPAGPPEGTALAGPVGAPATGSGGPGGWAGWGPVPGPGWAGGEAGSGGAAAGGAAAGGAAATAAMRVGGRGRSGYDTGPGATSAMPVGRSGGGAPPPVGPPPGDPGGWAPVGGVRPGGADVAEAAGFAGGPRHRGTAAPGGRGGGLRPGGASAAGRSARRGRRGASGLVVGGLATAAVVVAALLLSGPVSRSVPGSGGGGGVRAAAPTGVYAASGASVWIAPGHTPDDASGVGAVIDGDLATAWHTDVYGNARFGNLYPGIGVAVHLAAPHVLHRLVVTSPGGGWAARAYVAAALPPPAAGTAGWGSPTGSAIATSRDTTIPLGGRRGSWVLLWLTSTGGPPYQASIDEVQVG